MTDGWLLLGVVSFRFVGVVDGTQTSGSRDRAGCVCLPARGGLDAFCLRHQADDEIVQVCDDGSRQGRGGRSAEGGLVGNVEGDLSKGLFDEVDGGAPGDVRRERGGHDLDQIRDRRRGEEVQTYEIAWIA